MPKTSLSTAMGLPKLLQLDSCCSEEKHSTTKKKRTPVDGSPLRISPRRRMRTPTLEGQAVPLRWKGGWPDLDGQNRVLGAEEGEETGSRSLGRGNGGLWARLDW
uniref:Uncharacterized protein n=1 Tax=Arundo donax TaxID=35708 RepID=A0A0A9DE59_ARUDO